MTVYGLGRGSGGGPYDPEGLRLGERKIPVVPEVKPIRRETYQRVLMKGETSRVREEAWILFVDKFRKGR